MQTIHVGDKIQFHYEDEPQGKPMFATVCKVLTDQQEGLGVEVETYAAAWIEVSVTTCDQARQTIMLGTDSKDYLYGRPVSVQLAS